MSFSNDPPPVQSVPVAHVVPVQANLVSAVPAQAMQAVVSAVPVQAMQVPLVANARVVQPAQFETTGNTREYLPKTTALTSVGGQVGLWTFLFLLCGFMIYFKYENPPCEYAYYRNQLRIVCAKKEIPIFWAVLVCIYAFLGPITIMNLPKLLVLDLNARVYRLTLVMGSYSVPLSSVTNIEAVDGCKATPIWQVKGSLTEMASCGSKGVFVKTADGYKNLCFSPVVGAQQFIYDFQGAASQVV